MTAEHDAQTQVARLLADYATAHDDGDVDALIQRFTEDGVFVLSGSDGSEVAHHRGHAALREMFSRSAGAAGREPHRHVVSNVVVDVDGSHALARSVLFLVAYRHGGLVPLLSGVYRDVVRRGGDGAWRFERRELRCDGPVT